MESNIRNNMGKGTSKKNEQKLKVYLAQQNVIVKPDSTQNKNNSAKS